MARDNRETTLVMSAGHLDGKTIGATQLSCDATPFNTQLLWAMTFDQRPAKSPSIWAKSISASRVWKPRLIAAWIRLWASGLRDALAEEIRIATEVLGRRERDRIDALLDRDKAGGRKFGDPMSERSDEIAELVGGQRAIDPTVPFSELRVVVLARST